MITHCLNDRPCLSGFDAAATPRLLFICKAEGREAAMPRVMHKHDERFELMFIQQGSGVYNIDGRGYEVRQGDLLLFNAGILHDENPSASDDLLIFSCGVEQLKFEGLPLNHLTTRSQVAVIHSGESGKDIQQLFHQIWHHVSSKKSGSAEIGSHLLCALLLLCRNLWNESQQEYESAGDLLGQRIKDYLDRHYKNDIDLKSLTAAINMNAFYLAHVFKAFSGYSPKHYQTRRRIGEAQTLLLGTESGVAEVAKAVGYDNVNNFHRIFHNLIGVPPGQYKRFWLSGQKRA
ncbi:AraC family transcriptional regulator [Erwinia pyri]|uniref:AraC family transcriptional regulator n=1 Tax=Erwinia pyri TaxID=3062598 RepID=A0AA50DMU6_9GAMM|nr:AraC family transcriptional regulator [Erwinia sp. DE2]WLS80844.1 AraC family transcriptional regulator [Erwinia sp. DE2]